MKNSRKQRSFFHHALICLPTYDKPGLICDFVEQTAKELSAQSVVIILSLGESARGISGISQWFKAIREASSQLKKGKPVLIRLSLCQFWPLQRFSFISQANVWLSIKLIAFLLNTTGNYNQRILWLSQPKESFVLPFFKNWWSHLDCVDWYQAQDIQAQKVLDQQREKIISVARSMTAISAFVQGQLQSHTEISVGLIPQGFSLESFQDKQKISLKYKQQLEQLKGEPLITYVGAISQRLDVSLLKKVISSHKNWQFLFIGPLNREENVPFSEKVEEELRKILSMPQVTWLPFVPRRHLLPYLQKSNALLIPYDMQFEFNKASFPMKVMEYFYAGKPIVATSLPSLKPYKEFINLADSSKEFDLAIKKSIREKWTVAKKHAARQIAKKQTWAQKITAVDEYLTKVLGSI